MYSVQTINSDQRSFFNSASVAEAHEQICRNWFNKNRIQITDYKVDGRRFRLRIWYEELPEPQARKRKPGRPKGSKNIVKKKQR